MIEELDITPQPDHEGDSKRVSLFCYNQMPVFFFCLF